MSKKDSQKSNKETAENQNEEGDARTETVAMIEENPVEETEFAKVVVLCRSARTLRNKVCARYIGFAIKLEDEGGRHCDMV